MTNHSRYLYTALGHESRLLNGDVYIATLVPSKGWLIYVEGEGWMHEDTFRRDFSDFSSGAAAQYVFEIPGAEDEGACFACNGTLMLLGTLGNVKHYRCRDCGITYS